MQRHFSNRQRIAYRQRRQKLLMRVLFIAFIIIFIVSAALLTRYGIRSRQTADTNAQLVEIYEESATPEPTAEPAKAPEDTATPPPVTFAPGVYQYIADGIPASAQKLYDINPDLIGWLKIPGVVNLPVVYRDNEYYLTHDFYGQESDSGALFLDVSHPLREDTQYLLIHGHAMYDGSMFGMITHYRDREFIKEHPYLTFTSFYSRDKYEIIGSLYVSEDEMYSIVQLGTRKFDSGEDFTAFIQKLRAQTKRFTDEEIPPDTAILALSTCYRDGRIVAFFKRISSEPLNK